MPALDETELDALPAWGTENPLPPEYAIYLALPDTITQRTRDLARELTADEPTMYAKATAIEEYLRQIPYDLEISAPPEGVTDVADYFLFDLRRGYCDYYATAFVVLARLSGLPTRFVTGFAPGSWLPNEQQWVITEAEAHSWPEVYFPEVGWVRFEPTAYRPQEPRIGLPDSSDLVGAAVPFEPLPPPEPLRAWLPLWWAALVAVPLVAVAWGAVYWRAPARRSVARAAALGTAGGPAHAGRRDYARVRQLTGGFRRGEACGRRRNEPHGGKGTEVVEREMPAACSMRRLRNGRRCASRRSSGGALLREYLRRLR